MESRRFPLGVRRSVVGYSLSFEGLSEPYPGARGACGVRNRSKEFEASGKEALSRPLLGRCLPIFTDFSDFLP